MVENEKKEKRMETGGWERFVWQCVGKPTLQNAPPGGTAAARVNPEFAGAGQRERGSILCLTDSFP